MVKTDETPVVVEVAINDHPLIVEADDERTDAELIRDVEQRTRTAEDLTLPEWTVFENTERKPELRYVNTVSRINVIAPYGTDVFEKLAERIEIDGFDMCEAAMSHPQSVPVSEFDGPIHLDLREE